MKFERMLKEIRIGYKLSPAEMAEKIGISRQYLDDLEAARRMPSVRVVESICEAFQRGPKGIKEWHAAGAQAHGWKVNDLVKEIERLEKEAGSEEASHLNTISQLDHAKEMADKLAARIAEIEDLDIGEHSSGNCPWQNALDGVSADPD